MSIRHFDSIVPCSFARCPFVYIKSLSATQIHIEFGVMVTQDDAYSNQEPISPWQPGTHQNKVHSSVISMSLIGHSYSPSSVKVSSRIHGYPIQGMNTSTYMLSETYGSCQYTCTCIQTLYVFLIYNRGSQEGLYSFFIYIYIHIHRLS